MKRTILAWTGALWLSLAVGCQRQAPLQPARSSPSDARTFPVQGVIQEIVPGNAKLVVQHEAVANYMPAMTMPFNVRNPHEISELRPGDPIRFRLVVTQNQSWIDQIVRTGEPKPAVAVDNPTPSPAVQMPTIADIPEFALTNELGTRVKWSDFAGKAVAMTFFFTRCPIPEYCPRLSRNFAEASEKLAAQSNGPTNWQLLSVSFDPLDTPAVLRQYARQYHYNSNHWRFLTGDPAHLQALTRGFGLSVTQQSGIFAHDFRTVIFDANGRLRAIWPIGGNTTDLLVQELTKAASVAPVPNRLPTDDK